MIDLGVIVPCIADMQRKACSTDAPPMTILNTELRKSRISMRWNGRYNNDGMNIPYL